MGPGDEGEPWAGLGELLRVWESGGPGCGLETERDSGQGLKLDGARMVSWNLKGQALLCFSPDLTVQDGCSSNSACGWVYVEQSPCWLGCGQAVGDLSAGALV